MCEMVEQYFITLYRRHFLLGFLILVLKVAIGVSQSQNLGETNYYISKEASEFMNSSMGSGLLNTCLSRISV